MGSARARSRDARRSTNASTPSSTGRIEGDWPDVWLDATYVKVRRDHHIVSVAVIVAVGANTDGRREVHDFGMKIGDGYSAGDRNPPNGTYDAPWS